MDASGLSDLSSDNLATLKHLSDLLHLFNHRNKNQHRRSIWFRHFSTFRKQLNTLVQDISEIREVPETHLQRIRKVKKDVARQQRLSQRLVLWQDVMVAKWHHAFSQTITENSFAVLGIFLLAVLSQVSQIVGVTARFEELGQAEVERAIEDFGKEYWAAEDQARPRESENEDFGEVIAREEEVIDSDRINSYQRRHRCFTRART